MATSLVTSMESAETAISSSTAIALSTDSPSSTSTIDLYALPGAPPGPTYSPPIPSPPTEPVYLFSFGDSMTSTGFQLSRTLPTPENPFGNPPYPGFAPRRGMVLWISFLTVNSNTTILNYNFAAGGMIVTNQLLGEAHRNLGWPSFEEQVNTFVRELATDPPPDHTPWTGANSIFVIWFCHNDITMKVKDHRPDSMYDIVFDAFEGALQKLADAGAQRIFIMGCPAMSREPIYHNFGRKKELELDVKKFDNGIRARLETLSRYRPNLALHHFDIRPTMHHVLDDPTLYGANDSVCINTDPYHKELLTWKCLWEDYMHPGPALNQAIGEAVRDEMRRLHWLVQPPTAELSAPEPSTLASSISQPVDECRHAVCLSGLQLSVLIGICVAAVVASWLFAHRMATRHKSYQRLSKFPPDMEMESQRVSDDGNESTSIDEDNRSTTWDNEDKRIKSAHNG